jgi:predicted nucleic acid-binding Zn ribbon protein
MYYKNYTCKECRGAGLAPPTKKKEETEMEELEKIKKKTKRLKKIEIILFIILIILVLVIVFFRDIITEIYWYEIADIYASVTPGCNFSQKKLTFNSQFLAYEGTRKGSKLRSLFNVIAASNATDEEHQVSCNLTNIGEIKVEETYTIECEYDSDGYINSIIIVEEGEK